MVKGVTDDIEVSCSNCGDDIIRQRRDVERSDNHFCSPECSSEFQRKGETRTCAFCGEDVYVPRARLGESENYFCDNECWGTHRRLGPAPFSLEPYPGWSLDSTVSVHQLVAIADGADPWRVFGNNGFNVDHENGCALDNRHNNIRVLSDVDHGSKDGSKNGNTYTHTDMLSVVSFFLDPFPRDRNDA